jgi:hypothetical protein
MTNSLEALKPIIAPKRTTHDWDKAVMRHCEYCSHYELTVLNEERCAICAECCDAEHIGNLESALDEAIKRIAELEARQLSVKLPAGTYVNGFQMLIESEVVAYLQAAGINAEVFRAAGGTVGSE